METIQSISIYNARRIDCVGNELASECRIINTVCEHFGVVYEALITRSRKRELVLPRQVIMYFLCFHTQLAYRRIGELFGTRDHTTAIHGKQTVKDLMDSDLEFRDEINYLKDKIFPFMPKTKIESKDDLITSYREALQLLGNMRSVQREWENTGSVPMKEKKKEWEKRADEYLNNLGGQPEIIIRP